MAAARCYELNDPSIVAETVDGEVMVMDLRNGVYYSIVGTGAAVWPALANGAPLHSIATSLARATDVTGERVARELDAFVARLVDEAILRPCPVREAPSGDGVDDQTPAFPEGLAYSGLTFERFDDMRAMLLLDPVHEVGEFGWPQPGDEGGR